MRSLTVQLSHFSEITRFRLPRFLPQYNRNLPKQKWSQAKLENTWATQDSHLRKDYFYNWAKLVSIVSIRMVPLSLSCIRSGSYSLASKQTFSSWNLYQIRVLTNRIFRYLIEIHGEADMSTHVGSAWIRWNFIKINRNLYNIIMFM